MPWYTEKVGPFPAYVYIGAAGVGLGVMVVRARNKAKDEQAAIPLDVSTTAGMQPGAGGVITLPNSAVTGTAGVDVAIKTNVDWRRAALTNLIADGADPTAADHALGRYLNGENLSDQENALVQIALRKTGVPPIPPPPPRIAPPTTTPPSPPPQSLPNGATTVVSGPTSYDRVTGLNLNTENAQGIGYQYGNRGMYTTVAGDTGSWVVLRVYGNDLHFADRWAQIVAANPSYNLPADRDAPLPAGLNLWLPL